MLFVLVALGLLLHFPALRRGVGRFVAGWLFVVVMAILFGAAGALIALPVGLAVVYRPAARRADSSSRRSCRCNTTISSTYTRGGAAPEEGVVDGAGRSQWTGQAASAQKGSRGGRRSTSSPAPSVDFVYRNWWS